MVFTTTLNGDDVDSFDLYSPDIFRNLINNHLGYNLNKRGNINQKIKPILITEESDIKIISVMFTENYIHYEGSYPEFTVSWEFK